MTQLSWQEAAKRHLESAERAQAMELLGNVVASTPEECEQLAVVLTELALAQMRAGEFSEARQVLQQAFQVLEQEQKPSLLAQILRNLGTVERDLGNLDRANEFYTRALSIFEELDERNEQGWVLTDLAILHKDHVRLTEARAFCERALSFLDGKEDPVHRAHALIALGLTLERLHNAQDAERYYQEALALYRQASDQENEALTLHNLGRLHDDQGSFEAALGYYQQAVGINQAIGAKLGEADDLSAIAAIFQITGLSEEALGIHQRTLELYETMGHRLGAIIALTNLAILSRDAGDLKAAVEFLNRALTLAHELGDPNEIYDVLRNRGDVYLMQERWKEAERDFVDAVEVMESVRPELLLEEEALGYFDESRWVAYERLITLYARPLRDLRQALLWLERMKAREFLRQLGMGLPSRPRGPPDALIARETLLMEQFHQAARALLQEEGPQRLKNVRSYQDIREELRALWAEMEPFDPEFVQLRRGEPITWKELSSCVEIGSREEG